MQFHTYRSLYSDLVKRGHKPPKNVSRSQAMTQIARHFHSKMSDLERLSEGPTGQDQQCETFAHLAMYEALWFYEERPYYNVWPSVLEMLLEVNLDLPATSIKLPHSVILLRLPHTFSPFMTVFASSVERGSYDADWSRVPKDVIRRIWVGIQKMSDKHGFVNGKVVFDVYEGDSIVECMSKTTTRVMVEGETEKTLDKDLDMAMRIACGVSILAGDSEFVQPIVLNKDQPKYEEANEAVKKYLEDKAAKKQGRGFDIGKDLEKRLKQERETSPHLRRPHMCLFWTGKGRSEPKLKLRRGAVIHPRSLTEVPTGYLDREGSNEDG